MEFSIVLINFFYAFLGALMTLGFMAIGYLLFDRLTPFDTAYELKQNNHAVGIVVGSIFVGLGIAIGLVIGMGLH